MIKVLFVEDDPDQIFMYESVFRKKGILLISVDNGKDAIGMAIMDNPDLILIDILLNKENGIDILEKLKKNEKTKNIPAVIFTNFDKEDLRKKSKELGAIDYIVKSDTVPDEVAEKIKKLLENIKK